MLWSTLQLLNSGPVPGGPPGFCVCVYVCVLCVCVCVGVCACVRIFVNCAIHTTILNT